jgi:hypothetical protein
MKWQGCNDGEHIRCMQKAILCFVRHFDRGGSKTSHQQFGIHIGGDVCGMQAKRTYVGLQVGIPQSTDQQHAQTQGDAIGSSGLKSQRQLCW